MCNSEYQASLWGGEPGDEGSLRQTSQAWWDVVVNVKGWSELTTVQMQKYVVIKQPGQLFWWPQSTYWKPQVCLGLHCSREAGLLYTRGSSFSKCSLHTSKFRLHSLNWTWSLFGTGGVDMTVTFFVEYALKSQALAYKNGKKCSVIEFLS